MPDTNTVTVLRVFPPSWKGRCRLVRIRILVLDISLVVELTDNATAREIWNALPIQSDVNTWGDEIYFRIPLKIPEAPDARADVQVGTVGYWPAGQALCVFFGPTPVSTDDRPRAASPVNVCGHVIGDASVLRKVKDGTGIKVERCGDAV